MNKATYVETKQNLAWFLTKMEEECSQKDFYAKLLEQQALDPDNFRVGTASIPGEKFPRAVVIGGHAISRSNRRLGANPDMLLAMAIHDLENPFVGVEVVSHSVMLEDNKVVPCDEDGIDSTVAIFEGKRYALVFQAGFNYILVKTVWDTWAGDFHTDRGNVVIHVSENTATSRELCNSEEKGN